MTSAMPENTLRKPSGRTTSILQHLAANRALRMCSNSYAHTEVAQALSNDEFVQYIRASPHALFDSRCEADSATNLSRLSRFFTIDRSYPQSVTSRTKKRLRNRGPAHEPMQAADSLAHTLAMDLWSDLCVVSWGSCLDASPGHSDTCTQRVRVVT